MYAEDQREHKPNGLAQLAVGISLAVNSPSQYVNDNLRFLNDAYNQMTEMMTGIGRLRKLFAADADPSVIWTEVESLCRAADRADVEDLLLEIPTAIAQSIDGVQLVSQIVTAMKEFSPQPHNVRSEVDLNKAIETTMLIADNELRYVADTHTVLDPELPLIWCLPGQINLVVLTLLTNAAHAIGEAARTQPGIGHITVSTRKSGSCVEFEVSDTGTGIPDSMQAHIFDPFFAGAGSGLNTGHGLALAHATIVHQHGGRIWFESEAGKGSSFFVSLPLRAGRSDNLSASRSCT
jgi:signal transduction histidine kinase